MAIVGEGGVGNDEFGDEGMAAMGESCDSSPSSHSSLSNSASHLRLAAFLVLLAGGEVTAGVGSICARILVQEAPVVEAVPVSLAQIVVRVICSQSRRDGVAGICSRYWRYSISGARVRAAMVATTSPCSRRTARGKSRRKSSV